MLSPRIPLSTKITDGEDDDIFLVKCLSSHGISSLSSRVLNFHVLGLRRNKELTVF